MPLYRLDLATELLLPVWPQLEKEEIGAFVNDCERQDDVIVARDLARFKAQGNFGTQKRGLGVRQEFDTCFIANEARHKVRYSFSNRMDAPNV